MKYFFLLFFLLAYTSGHLATTSAKTLHIVAVEECYGDIARQIGGDDVQVTVLLSHHLEGPHHFEPSASIAKQIEDADLVIKNGIDYDDWADKLLAASPNKNRQVITVADLIGAHSGDNPHLWYNPHTILVLAKRLAPLLKNKTAIYHFQESLEPIFKKMEDLSTHYSGTAVSATEPVINLLLEQIHFQILNLPFQYAIMNDTEPNFGSQKDFEESITNHKIKILFYNTQVNAPLAEKMKTLAEGQSIPIIGVQESEPADIHYQEWILSLINKIEAQLH